MDGTREVTTHEDGGQSHHGSRWPIVAAVGAAALYGGVGLVFAGGSLLPQWPFAGVAVVGALVMVGGLAGWAYEAFVAEYWAEEVDRSRLYVAGMTLFLLTDVATFGAGFVYYAFIRVGPGPPSELPPLLGSLVLVNTLVLLVSSGTLHLAHGALESGNRNRFVGLLGGTVALGVIFVGGQVLEYYEFLVEEGFTLSGSIFASAFYGLTGLHGLHVAFGVLLLGTVFGRALRGHYSAERDTAVRTAALYWHFVDGVWILLVLVLYVGSVLG